MSQRPSTSDPSLHALLEESWGDQKVELTRNFSEYATRPPLPIAPTEQTREYFIHVDNSPNPPYWLDLNFIPLI